MSETTKAADAVTEALAWLEAVRLAPNVNTVDAAARLCALVTEVTRARTVASVERGRADVLTEDHPALRRRTDGSWTYEDADENEHYGATWREAVDAYITSGDRTSPDE